MVLFAFFDFVQCTWWQPWCPTGTLQGPTRWLLCHGMPQLFYMFFYDLLIVLSCIIYGFRMTMEKTFKSYRLWICWDLVCGMFGITTHTRKFLLWDIYRKVCYLSVISNTCRSLLCHVLFHFVNFRMSIEMVACIAIESISILEKMHSRGWGMLLLICLQCLFVYEGKYFCQGFVL